jgi:hypothetical protein
MWYHNNHAQYSIEGNILTIDVVFEYGHRDKDVRQIILKLDQISGFYHDDYHCHIRSQGQWEYFKAFDEGVPQQLQKDLERIWNESRPVQSSD